MDEKNCWSNPIQSDLGKYKQMHTATTTTIIKSMALKLKGTILDCLQSTHCTIIWLHQCSCANWAIWEMLLTNFTKSGNTLSRNSTAMNFGRGNHCISMLLFIVSKQSSGHCQDRFLSFKDTHLWQLFRFIQCIIQSTLYGMPTTESHCLRYATNFCLCCFCFLCTSTLIQPHFIHHVNKQTKKETEKKPKFLCTVLSLKNKHQFECISLFETKTLCTTICVSFYFFFFTLHIFSIIENVLLLTELQLASCFPPSTTF